MTSLPYFNHNADDWKIYKSRFDNFCDTAKIADHNSKRAIFLDCIGGETFTILYDLCKPKIPSVITYDNLCTLLSTHFSPPTILYEERQKFFRSKRDESENVQQWGLRLKSLASKCQFGNRLNQQLADQFVAGLDGCLFQKLCEEEELTFEKAMLLAHAFEIRCKNKSPVQSTTFVM